MARSPSRSAEDKVRLALAVLRGELTIAEAPEGAVDQRSGRTLLRALKYERLYRHDIGDGVDLAVHADSFRTIYNSIRPHVAIAMARPLERYRQTVSAQQEMPAGGQQWLPSHGHLVTLRCELRDGRAC
ncbi:MAG TPA: hypothetical protein VFV02_10040 [Acidimicrobiales bacterium]|nr:hypothetical protein [Acidimicrobiales bacterium]